MARSSNNKNGIFINHCVDLSVIVVASLIDYIQAEHLGGLNGESFFSCH